MNAKQIKIVNKYLDDQLGTKEAGFGGEYDEKIKKSVLALVELFISQNHSGCSAMITLSLFDEIISKNLDVIRPAFIALTATK